MSSKKQLSSKKRFVRYMQINRYIIHLNDVVDQIEQLFKESEEKKQ